MNNDILMLAEFSDKLLAADSFNKLANLLIEYVSKATKPHYASFMLFDLRSLALVLEKRRGYLQKRRIPPTVERCTDAQKCRSPYGAIFVLPDSEAPHFFLFFDPEEPHACEIRIPFIVCSDYLGVINLGRKKSGEEYSSRDLNFFQVLSNLASIASFRSQLCPGVGRTDKSEGNRQCLRNGCSGSAFVKPRIRVSSGKLGVELLGDSPAMRHIREIISQVAGEDVSVLISGETGTGKELIAHALHASSRRADKPLAAINCAALPEALVESELFGHEKGAFTGAFERKKGKFEYADGSTLFLDEIGDMSLPTQARLLRVLQDGTFHRVGGVKPIFADVRIIAASNRDLYEMVCDKTFREDLYYRLNVVQIEAPPLRERGDDILLLVDYYFNYFNDHYEKHLSGFSEEAMNWLLGYDFPGNVRELKNIIERAVIMEKSDKITLASFPKPKSVRMAQRTDGAKLRELEKEHILAVMRQVHNNKSEAARRLGIARKTLREKLQKYQII